MDFRHLMECSWTIQVWHIFYEANGCTDTLAKRRNQQQCFLKIYDIYSAFVYVPFVWDMENLRTSRLCPLKLELHVVV